MASLPLGQADGMSAGAIYIGRKVFVLNNFVCSMNSVRWIHYESIRRRSLAAIRKAAGTKSIN